MAFVFYSARQIAEAAVEKEKLRRIFYATVADLSADEDMQNLFQFLAEEENKHVEAFTQIWESLPAGAGPVEHGEEMDIYMDSAVDDRLYSKMNFKEFVRQAINADDVFRLAIGFERDAILYFMEFLPFLAESDRKIVVGLIAQEKDHIRKLRELKKRIDGFLSYEDF